MSVRENYDADTVKADLPMLNRKWNMTQKLHPTLEPSSYKQPPIIRMFSAEKSVCPRRFIGDGPDLLHTHVLHVLTISPRGAFYFHRTCLVARSTYVHVHTCLEEERRLKSVWELHTSATPPPLLLFSNELTTKSRRTYHLHIYSRPPHKRKLLKD